MAEPATLLWLRSAIERAASTDECILDWPFHRGHKGYPVMKWQGKARHAHIVVLELVGRPLPAGLQARHRCGRGRQGCLHPNHLLAGTNQQNADDRALLGEEPRGEAKPGAKLTEADVRSIRASDEPVKAMARRYSVDPHTIRKIRNRERWAHVV